MNSTKSDYQNINLLVQSLTHAEDERDYTYVTIDGLKAFSLACPLCSPDSKRKTAKIFPKIIIYVRVRVIVLVKAFILSTNLFRIIVVKSSVLKTVGYVIHSLRP